MFEMLIEKRRAISYRVVSFSVELDHYQAFPFGSFSELKEQTERRSPYVMHLLRSLVWQHVYVFPMASHQLRRVCNAAGLEMKQLAVVKRFRDD